MHSATSFRITFAAIDTLGSVLCISIKKIKKISYGRRSAMGKSENHAHFCLFPHGYLYFPTLLQGSPRAPLRELPGMQNASKSNRKQWFLHLAVPKPYRPHVYVRRPGASTRSEDHAPTPNARCAHLTFSEFSRTGPFMGAMAIKNRAHSGMPF